MFYLTFTDFCKYKLILNLMSVKHFKQAGTGATEDWESCVSQKSLERNIP